MVRHGHLFVVALVLSSALASAQEKTAEAPPAPPVTVRTSVSQTAIWVGDPLLYTVEIVCPQGTDILADDISRDRLRVTGLEIVDANQQREVREDGTIVHRAEFRLTSFTTDGSAVRIDPQPVRYYVNTAGRPVDALVPADEVQLPVVDIVVRSTLPGRDLPGIRDAYAFTALPGAMRLLTPAGVGAVALALAPVVIGLTGTVARVSKPRRTTRSKRQSRQFHRQALAEIKAMDVPDDPDARRGVFEKLNVLIREYLVDLDIPARALTAEELEKRISERTKDPAAVEMAEILRHCERACYGGPGHVPARDVLSNALDKTDEFLLARIR